MRLFRALIPIAGQSRLHFVVHKRPYENPEGYQERDQSCGTLSGRYEPDPGSEHYRREDGTDDLAPGLVRNPCSDDRAFHTLPVFTLALPPLDDTPRQTRESLIVFRERGRRRKRPAEPGLAHVDRDRPELLTGLGVDDGRLLREPRQRFAVVPWSQLTRGHVLRRASLLTEGGWIDEARLPRRDEV